MKVYIKTVPVRVEIDISHVNPPHPSLEESPLVSLRARISLGMRTSVSHQPLWVDAKVQLSPDGAAKIVWMDPVYGNITGFQSKQALNPFKDALLRALQDSRLKILGVE